MLRNWEECKVAERQRKWQAKVDYQRSKAVAATAWFTLLQQLIKEKMEMDDVPEQAHDVIHTCVDNVGMHTEMRTGTVKHSNNISNLNVPLGV